MQQQQRKQHTSAPRKVAKEGRREAPCPTGGGGGGAGCRCAGGIVLSAIGTCSALRDRGSESQSLCCKPLQARRSARQTLHLAQRS